MILIKIYIKILGVFYFLIQSSYILATEKTEKILDTVSSAILTEVSENMSQYKILDIVVPKEIEEANKHKVQQSDLYLFAEKLRLNTSITVLTLQNIQLKEYGAAKIAWAIREGVMITELDLSNNDIRDRGVGAIAEAIKNENSHCRILRLLNNTIRDQGAAYLSKALSEEQCTLEELNLGNNEIGDVGALELGEALFTNQSLQVIGLKGNNIKGKGFAGLASGIEYNSALIKINLSRNQIQENENYEGLELNYNFQSTYDDLLKRERPIQINLKGNSSLSEKIIKDFGTLKREEYFHEKIAQLLQEENLNPQRAISYKIGKLYYFHALKLKDNYYFSEAKAYLSKFISKEYDLCLMSELPMDKKPLANKVYLEKDGGQLKYKVLNPAKEIVEDALDMQTDGELTPEILLSLKSKILDETLRRGHTLSKTSLSPSISKKQERTFSYLSEISSIY